MRFIVGMMFPLRNVCTFLINSDYLYVPPPPDVEAERDQARKKCCVGPRLTHASVQITFSNPKHSNGWNNIDSDRTRKEPENKRNRSYRSFARVPFESLCM
jgi:hypothetical protein